MRGIGWRQRRKLDILEGREVLEERWVQYLEMSSVKMGLRSSERKPG